MPRPRKNPTPISDIYRASQMVGMAMMINADVLEKWLNTNPPDFWYERELRAAIDFKRTLEKPPTKEPEDADKH